MNNQLRPRYFPTALLLAGASAVATALAFPYLVVIVPKLRQAPVPVPLVVAVLAGQAGLQALLFAWAGLRLGETVKLGAPFVRAWLARRASAASPSLPRAHWWTAAGIGILCSGVVALVDRLVLMPSQPEAIRVLSSQIESWRGFLAAFYGGVVEEILVRLFLMTAIVWLLAKIFPRQPQAIFIVAVVVAAFMFGLGHLPATAKIVPLDSLVVGRVLVLNTMAGIVFGLVYWRWGLEHAMLCHFCADVVLHCSGG